MLQQIEQRCHKDNKALADRADATIRDNTAAPRDIAAALGSNLVRPAAERVRGRDVTARRRWEQADPEKSRAIRRRWYLRRRAEQIVRMRAYRMRVKLLRTARQRGVASEPSS